MLHMDMPEVSKYLLENSEILQKIVINILRIVKVKKAEIERTVIQNLSRRSSNKVIISRPSKTVINVSQMPSILNTIN